MKKPREFWLRKIGFNTWTDKPEYADQDGYVLRVIEYSTFAQSQTALEAALSRENEMKAELDSVRKERDELRNDVRSIADNSANPADRWREKYYDKIDELNRAETELAECRAKLERDIGSSAFDETVKERDFYKGQNALFEMKLSELRAEVKRTEEQNQRLRKMCELEEVKRLREKLAEAREALTYPCEECALKEVDIEELHEKLAKAIAALKEISHELLGEGAYALKIRTIADEILRELGEMEQK